MKSVAKVAAIVAAIMFVSVAEARVHHHRRHHVERVIHHASRVERSDADSEKFHLGFFTSVGNHLVEEARSQIGNGAIYGRSRLWCARFMNWVLSHTGHAGTDSDMAASFAHYGHAVSPQVGAIAVMRRRGGGHVGVVSGFDASGNPVVISGNHGGRVREAVYPRRRVYAYVAPN